MAFIILSEYQYNVKEDNYEKIIDNFACCIDGFSTVLCSCSNTGKPDRKHRR